VEVPHIGAKCLAVATKGMPMVYSDPGIHLPSRNTGQLEVHGKKRLRTWTKLNQTAYAGDDFVVTSERVDFADGEKVILPGTEVPGGTFSIPTFQYEEKTVLYTDESGYKVFFTEPLLYTHRSEWVTIAGRTVDLRSEIGLLTRNVKIQGDADVSDGQEFGVHTVAMMSGIFRIENTEVTRCGQAFNFGRYCTHSHEAGNMEGSYVKANSIHHSYQRAVTTHDTHNWEVRDNVAFNVKGHTFFVEKGKET
jgi:hypothetical protein